MTTEMPCISINPSANRHGLFLTVLGIILFIFFMLIGQYYFQQARIVLIFCFLMCIVITGIGLLKRFEPKVSFFITPEAIIHQHKYGQWSLPWQSIKRIGLINQTVGLSTQSLPYIGIALNELKVLSTHISPRLASRLIHEQKVLLIHCINHDLLRADQGIINFTPFRHIDGTITKGPVAAFLHQSQLLNQALGYHLFINAGSIDRPPEDFRVLLQQCKQTALVKYT